MKREWNTLARRGGQLAILMIDIDLFKQLNDFYGHQTGDACLIAVAKLLQDLLPRSGDFVGRYGGEEFAVILPQTSASRTETIAKRLRLGVEGLAIPHAKSPYGRVTISIGAAVGNAAGVTDLHVLVKSADQALYRGKEAVRHRVAVIDLNEISELALVAA